MQRYKNCNWSVSYDMSIVAPGEERGGLKRSTESLCDGTLYGRLFLNCRDVLGSSFFRVPITGTLLPCSGNPARVPVRLHHVNGYPQLFTTSIIPPVKHPSTNSSRRCGLVVKRLTAMQSSHFKALFHLSSYCGLVVICY